MADFRKSDCCSCSDNKTCPEAFTEFAAELCPKGKDANRREKTK